MTQNDGNDGRIYTTYYIYLTSVSIQRISAKWVSTF